MARAARAGTLAARGPPSDTVIAVNRLVDNASKALADFEPLTQEQVDHIVAKASVAALDQHTAAPAALGSFDLTEPGAVRRGPVGPACGPVRPGCPPGTAARSGQSPLTTRSRREGLFVGAQVPSRAHRPRAGTCGP